MTAMPGPKDLSAIMSWLGDDAGADNFDELCRAVAAKKNKEHAARFAKVPYDERIVLVPQCLRRLGKCGATETAKGYDCARCMECPAGEIAIEAERLGYKGVFMLKGGRAVAAFIADMAPRAIVGIACQYEGALGIMECERAGAAVQFVPLSCDGCSETDVNIDEVKIALAILDES
jgi:hypothetical protein